MILIISLVIEAWLLLHTWRKWINACLQFATISILINGSPTKEFAPTRGLRQGDPLAPLLFNIVAEGLTGMMRVAIDNNLYTSFQVGKQNKQVNILQYADDTIETYIISSGNEDCLKGMKSMTSEIERIIFTLCIWNYFIRLLHTDGLMSLFCNVPIYVGLFTSCSKFDWDTSFFYALSYCHLIDIL